MWSPWKRGVTTRRDAIKRERSCTASDPDRLRPGPPQTRTASDPHRLRPAPPQTRTASDPDRLRPAPPQTRTASDPDRLRPGPDRLRPGPPQTRTASDPDQLSALNLPSPPDLHETFRFNRSLMMRPSPVPHENLSDGPRPRVVRVSFRQQSVSGALGALRRLVPTHPPDRKLSKNQVLRLALRYISLLDQVLTDQEPRGARGAGRRVRAGSVEEEEEEEEEEEGYQTSSCEGSVDLDSDSLLQYQPATDQTWSGPVHHVGPGL
ncbi:T-cell acute lymphocytic leukemia protein 1 [Liparis tanakae]|uniref:T-cell acute lymphocytic leukemia protein 1 n=1 Tax=Liparis tanakae TaxID=230148 RepID=A0A4Z2E770_9TELE|nr:T-cell acute lymphocytic leukemia protein 1 [Liparis tanakae]